MPLNQSTFKLEINGAASSTSGSSTLTGKTIKALTQTFIDGAGAGAATSIVEGTIQNNNSAIALSTLATNMGVAVSAQTKLKAILIANEGAATTTVSSTITGLPVGVLGATSGDNIAWIAAANPTAGGWTCSSSSTITSNGTAGQYIRVILFLA
jgi:hypothetical protein